MHGRTSLPWGAFEQFSDRLSLGVGQIGALRDHVFTSMWYAAMVVQLVGNFLQIGSKPQLRY
jgi:hypothetical protein